MTLSDSEFGGMNAKMWDVKDADEEEFITGKLVKIQARSRNTTATLQIIASGARA